MDLLHRFKRYVEGTLQIKPMDTILLTVSGGKDSMLMAFLFKQLGYKGYVAHCNFQLRGKESDKDEQLVESYAEQLGFPLMKKRFDTESYARQEGISIQMAARDLRYAWFEELRQSNNISWIAVAQHRNDHLETVLLNLTRGTGLQGLQGILPKRGTIIRPLLFLTADEIAQFVLSESIPYRDDQSNFSTRYARNKIRLEIIPKFKEITADFETVLAENIVHFQESYQLLESFIEPIRTRIFDVKADGTMAINKNTLMPYLSDMPLLYALFRPYGFSKAVLGDLAAQKAKGVGTVFDSATHRLWVDRDKLFLQKRDKWRETDGQRKDIAETDTDIHLGEMTISCAVSTDLTIVRDKKVAKLDYDRLIFPLTLRYWEEADTFCPLGMQGKKKLSDFFIQQKVPVFKKKQIPILVNGNGDVLWIVNYQLDNRYKITESTKKVFTLVCN